MAGKVVDVTLKLVDKMTSPLQRLNGNLKQSAGQWIKAGQQIQKAGNNIAKTGTSLTKKVTAPVVTAGTACVKLAADFEKGMSTVQSISGATGEELDKLSKKAKEMGQKTKFSATEATEAYKYMAMAGWKSGQMLDGISGIMYLAGATGEDLASTSDIVTDSLTAFGMSAKDTNTFVDVLAKTANTSNTNVGMLGESFKYVAPVAGALGYKVQDVSVALGLMANNGIKASQAGTSVRSWLSRMADPTDKVAAAMKKLGISLTDSHGNMKSMDKLMRETRTAFDGLSKAQKSQYASTLAGKSGMSGLLAIVNSSDKDFKNLTKEINNSSGACKKMYDVANNNLSGQITVLKSTVESLAISFGERLTPYVSKLVTYAQKLTERFNSLNDEQKDTVVRFAAIAAAIGPGLIVFGKMVTAVGAVAVRIGKFGKELRSFGSLVGIITSPAGIVIGVLAAIAAAVFLVVKNWDKIKPVLDQAAQKTKKTVDKIKPYIMSVIDTVRKQMPAIKKTVKNVFDTIKPILSMVGQLLKVLAKTIGQVLVKAFRAAVPVVKKFAEMFKVIFPVIVKVVGVAVNLLMKYCSLFANKIKIAFSVATEWVKYVGETFSDIFSGVMKAMGGVMDFITGVFTGNWKKAWSGVKDIFSGMFSSLVTVVEVPLNTIITLINGVIKGLNKVKIPEWVPGLGGKGFNLPTLPKLPKLAAGTNNWRGGIVQISERGGEIVDLPQGSRVYPHDKSVQKAYADGTRASGGKKVVITIPKLADKIVVRSDEDIDRIAQKLADKLEKTSQNLGDEDIGYLY